MNYPLTWVVGAGGLLGSASVCEFSRRGPVWSVDSRLPWGSAELSSRMCSAVTTFAAAANNRPWQVVWAAGAGVTGTSAAQLQREADVLGDLLAALGQSFPSSQLSMGSVFLASSAGGLYAGSAEPPFTERSKVRPISAYGNTKLAMEHSVRMWAKHHRVPAVIGRIANLYGPGQDLAKPQGLISQVCRAQLLRQPIPIYVPLDTLRDYLHVRDCARLIAGAVARSRMLAEKRGPDTHVKVMASESGITVAAVLAELRRVLKRRPLVIHASAPAGRLQARDLRLRSIVWPELERTGRTPLPVGIHEVAEAQAQLLRAGRL